MIRIRGMKCASCGAAIEPNAGGWRCPYCGTYQYIQTRAESGDQLVREGIAAYKAAEYATAEERFKQAIGRGLQEFAPAQVYQMLGDAQEELGKPDEAVASYNTALALDARCYKAWVGLGIIYRKKGDFEQAKKCYEQAIALSPDYAEAHASLGALYIFLNMPAEAVKVLEKAVEINQTVPVAFSNLALAYAMRKRFAEAEEALRRAVMLGYKNFKDIKQRIDGLKELG